MGDFSKEIDKRVKDEVAKMREKDDYEVRIVYIMMSILLYKTYLMHI